MTHEQARALLRKTMTGEYADLLATGESFRTHVAAHGLTGALHLSDHDLIAAVCESGWADHDESIGDAVCLLETTLADGAKFVQR